MLLNYWEPVGPFAGDSRPKAGLQIFLNDPSNPGASFYLDTHLNQGKGGMSLDLGDVDGDGCVHMHRVLPLPYPPSATADRVAPARAAGTSTFGSVRAFLNQHCISMTVQESSRRDPMLYHKRAPQRMLGLRISSACACQPCPCLGSATMRAISRNTGVWLGLRSAWTGMPEQPAWYPPGRLHELRGALWKEQTVRPPRALQDNDGDLDMLMLCSDMLLYVNLGNGDFTRPRNWLKTEDGSAPETGFTNLWSAEFADMDSKQGRNKWPRTGSRHMPHNARERALLCGHIVAVGLDALREVPAVFAASVSVFSISREASLVCPGQRQRP